jgi:hypothetical protein
VEGGVVDATVVKGVVEWPVVDGAVVRDDVAVEDGLVLIVDGLVDKWTVAEVVVVVVVDKCVVDE